MALQTEETSVPLEKRPEILLLSEVAGKHLALIPHSLDYFQSRFIGESMAASWSLPPFKVSRKGASVRDFVIWMAMAPVVSEKAKGALEPLIGPHVEFLPFAELKKGKLYYALNVLTLVDYLDLEKSDVLFSPSTPGKILRIRKYKFKTDLPLKKPPIFMLREHPSYIFVTPEFAGAVVQNGLTGLHFLDPWTGQCLIDCA